MKEYKRRFGAMAVAMALTLSLIPTSLIPTARAAEGEEGGGGTTTAPTDVSATGSKPTLHIDFLGDGEDYFLYMIPQPTDHDVSLDSHATAAADAYWSKYKQGDELLGEDRVFWVGIGIDKMDAFELAKQGGLYSAEFALYYNTDYVMPAEIDDNTGAGDFQTVIENYNLGQGATLNPRNQWDSDLYKVTAEWQRPSPNANDPSQMDPMDPIGDPATEEYDLATKVRPGNGEWKMLYTSVERKEDSTGANRFATLPGNDDTYYLMMIPFVLLNWDPNLDICFRLARNASLFSVGAGTKGESLTTETNAPAGGFGAWEKETRNPGHNLKEMFDFEGDLNIFTGKRETDTHYAQLNLDNGGSTNGAELSITNDYSVPPIMVDTDGSRITDLQTGTSMTVKLTGTGNGYTASVTVTRASDGQQVTLTPDANNPGQFTFIMPEDDVNVNVTYLANDKTGTFNATLHVVDGGDATRNTATMQEKLPDGTDLTPPATVAGPATSTAPATAVVTRGNQVKVFIPHDAAGNPLYNTDYDVTVTAVTTTGSNVQVTTDVANKEYSLTMPASDVDITVTYTKATTYEVQLVVDEDQTGYADNKAELYFYDGGGTIHSITADQRNQPHDPVMGGARDGRQINGIISLHQTTNTNPPPAMVPDYQIKKVTLFYSDGVTPPVELAFHPITAAEIAADPYMANGEWYITMPDGSPVEMPQQDITIKVEFEKIGLYNVQLILNDPDNVTGNTATLKGTDSVLGTNPSTNMPTVDNFDIHSGSKLELDLQTAPGYKVARVEARNTTNGALESPSGGSIASGHLEYRMPADDLKITVYYEREDNNLYRATLQLTPNVPSGASNTAAWVSKDGTSYVPPVYPRVENHSGTVLESDIQVAPGWHISTVEVISETGVASYPFSITGNGYNNGAGGTVKLTMTQPADHVLVKILFSNDPPPEEPKRVLDLAVRDDDNKPGNKAQLLVNGTNLSGDVRATGGYGIYSTSSAAMGDKVQVTMDCEPGYYIADVSVTPAGAGVVPNWVSAGEVEFTMPSGNATVTVTYKPIDPNDPPTHTITLHTDPATLPGGNSARIEDNVVHTPALPTPNVATADGGTILAYTGDSVRVDVTTDPSKVALVYATQPGGVLILTPSTGTTAGGSVPANTFASYTFVAPNADADVYVKFLDPQDLGDYVASLTVIDDEGGADGAAGSATLTRTGSGSGAVTVQSAAMPGNTDAITANAGDGMVLTVSPQSGYSVSVAYVTPSGAATLLWTGTQTASFVMPNKDVGVVVRFHKGDPTKYTVDLNVTGPAGAGVASLGTVSTAGIYSQQHEAGDGVDFAITANPGYYIQSVTVTPAPLGIVPSLSGTVGSQSGGFTMPAANVYVNVVFAEGYPDTAEYAATLKVVDPSAPLGGTAQMKNTDPARLAATNRLSGGQQQALLARAGDVMEVEVAANPGYVPTITITDNAGNPVNYQWSDATHIRFDMAGGPTLVEVRFDEGDKKDYKVTLHVDGLPGDNATIEVTPAGTPATTVTVPASGGLGTPSSIQAPVGSTIQVTANATATPAGFVQSVVVMQGANMISITPVANYNMGSYTGTFTVPEGDVDVYVYTGDTAGPQEPEYPVMLTATATDGSAVGVAGEAWIAPSDGTTVDMANKSANAQSEGASVYFSAVGGGHYRVHGDPNSGYVVSAIRITPAGSGLSTTVPFTWIDGSTVEFDMPFQPMGIEVEFKPTDEVPDDLTAQVVVNGAGSVNNKGEIYETANGPVAGQTLIVTSNGTGISVDITVATGYEIDFVELRSNIFGVSRLPLTAPADQSQTLSFTMLPDDVVVYVKMKKAAATTFTATLEIVDTSSSFINTASMSAGGSTVTGHGRQITGLADGTQVSTVPIPDAAAWNNNEVRLVAVLATDSNGTTTLTGMVNGSGTQYDYTIQNSDVTITVIYADYTEGPDEHTYVAKVVKDDPTGNDDNTAIIRNTENTALPHGTTWTEAWPGHALQVNVTAASGYYAVVTATRDDNGASVPVMQIGSAGNVTAYLNLPDDGNGLSSDVTVKVEYIQGTPPAASHKATIDLVDLGTLGGSNSATMTERGNTANTNTDANGAENVGADLPQNVAEGAQLDITTVCSVAHVSLVTLTSNGVTVTLTKADGAAVATMPNADAVVKVYLEDNDPTPRPYDPAQDPSGNGYIDGYLKAQRGSQGRALIEVPYLYGNGWIYDAPNSVTYHLYVKAGSEYVRLIPGTDYEVTEGYDEYAVTPRDHSTGIGTKFTIRALKGNSSLSDWLVNGGVIYITAALPTAQIGTWSESDYVEVELPADPMRGKHKATLRIVDFSSKTGNGASMSDGYRTVSVDGGVLDDLLGGELIKTSVTVGQGAVLVGVTVTDSVGSRPLSPDSTGRYPYDMTDEDIVITVYFDDDGTLDPDDPELYIASVQKAGLSGVAGNDADIHNSTRSDLPSGVIWAAGYAGNDMSVDVETAAGYYAIVTAFTATDNTPLPVVQLGAGDPNNATSFQALVSIPDGSLINGVAVNPDDVRVVVTFTKEKPDNYESALTLTTVGTNGPTVTGNSATLQPNGMAAVQKNEDGTWLVPDGTVPPATGSTTRVAAGTALDLTTTSDTNYYVDSVVVTIATSPAGSMTVTLDANGAAGFAMPLGASDVKVTWKQGAHTLRPYDNTHEPPIPAPATQPGWILAEHTKDQNGDTTNDGLLITVPTLHEGTTADPYENAINTVDPDDIIYKLYIKDSYGAYHELTGADISRTQIVPGTTNIGAVSYKTATFELTSLLPASTLHYYIKHGGVIYITATDTGASTGTAKSESYYTEVIIPANYTATLHVSQGTVTGNSATLSAPNGQTVTAPPDKKLTGLNGTETLTTVATPVTGSHLVSVVATTASGGSVHLSPTGSNYDYTMAGEDVDIYVVFQDDDDPLGDMYTATVQRVHDGGKAGNTASIVNEDVSTVPTGSIWTGAYKENVVRVDVTTEPGYYATVTAVLTGTTTPVPVIQWATQGSAANPAKAHLTMPAHDVDVIVTYSTDPPEPNELKLTLVDPAGRQGNSATLKAPNNANAVTVLGNSAVLTQSVPNRVSAGTALTLTTTTATGYAVKEAYMEVTTAGGTVQVAIPLTNGAALPLPVMPLGAAEVFVVYMEGHQTPRPYDPAHAHVYTNSYDHNSADDLSSTHQDGWLLAQPTGSDSLHIVVPTLHDMSGAGGADQLHHAGYSDPQLQPTYKLYWRDSLGFHEFQLGYDIEISNGQFVPGAYNSWNGYEFDVKVKSATALWGGYHLDQYLKNGGSIYITATGTDTTAPDVESEKTEVVVPKNDRFTATLHISDVSGLTGNGVTMSEVGGTQAPVTVDLGQLTDLTAGTTVRTAIAPLNPNAQVAGVVATVNGSSVNLTDSGSDVYDYVMGNADVDIYVVIQNKNDPLGDMYIATVYKDDPDNKPGNKAEVIVNEDVPTVPNGPVWTGAYKDNVIRVEVETEPGYYAIVTAKTVPGGAEVPVIQWATQSTAGNPAKSQFYMPASDVDVTVTFTTEKPDSGKLRLTIDGATDGNANNNATLSTATDSVTVNGTDSPLTKPFPTGTVDPGETLTLTTAADTANDYAVKEAKMKITVPVGGGGSATTITVDVPLTNGVSLPLLTMPLGDAEVIVTYESGVKQTPRPYDPDHSTAYNGANYPTTVADKSQTHQEGWLLATPTGTDSFHLVVPTLHDMSGAGGTDQLHHAGYDPAGTDAALQPSYKLYWRDGIGAFHEFTAADITVSNGQYVPGAYNSWNGYEFDVQVVSATALWGGYHLDQYLKNGGSIYITATGPNTNGTPADRESEKTEVVVPETYIATLHIRDVSGVPGSTVTMSEAVSGQSVTQDGDRIVNLAGNETINTLIAPVSAAVRVVGVVATTENGSVNLTNTGTGGTFSYDYVMQQTDVDIYVVIQAEDDPLDEMYIATVYKVDPDQRPGNKAEVIVNEDVSPIPHDQVWTAGYGGNVIRVDVETEAGYYATVTAVETGTTTPVQVVQWGSTGSFSSQFYMVEHDVDVTVTFSKEPPENRNLYLTLDLPTGGELNGNMAQLTAGAASLTLYGSAASGAPANVQHIPMPSNPVPAGQVLELLTGSATGFSVKSAEMRVTMPGNTSGTPDFTVSIPLTDGKSLPDFNMPLADAEVVVHYEVGSQTPRPYDPAHAHVYTNSYNHNSTDDLSSTHQDGWLLAQPTGSDSFTLLVPTLHDMDRSVTPAVDRLHNAGDAVPTNPQPTYKFYWRDSVGQFEELTGITITGQRPVTAPTAGTYGAFVGYELDVKVNDVYEKWGGYHLAQYIAKGGSIYVTATGIQSTDVESEKTEVVFPKRSFTATLHISDVSGLTGNGVTMSEVGGTQAPVTVDLGQLTDLTAGTTVRTAIAPLNPNAQVAGVVATVNGSSVNLTDSGSDVYDYVMGSADVDIYVVIQNKNDPLGDMYIATVYKDDPDNKPGNKAEVIVNEDVPTVPNGPVWTGAYEDNVIRVEVETEPGYYAIVTAKTTPGGAEVPVIQWATQSTAGNPAKSQFYMPASDVDVTVTFTTEKPASGNLKLTIDGDTDGNANNNSTLSTATNSVTVNGTDNPLTKPFPTGTVDPGETLTLTTAADTANNYAMKEAKMQITVPVGGGGSATTITVDVPLTNGVSLPLLTMPLGDAEVIVTYESGVKQTPRPYDPDHSTAYNGANYPTTVADKSQTHQEGWLLATPTGTDSFHLVVPTLHDMSGAGGTDQLHHAGYDPAGTDAALQPSYKLYWRDGIGAFHEFTAADITVSNGQYVPGAYNSWNGYEFDVQVVSATALWGGYHLDQYLKNGGSIYITATGPNTNGTPADMESEKTEVVVPGLDKYKATLRYTPNGTAATMTAWNKTTTADGGVLTGSNGTEVVKVSGITPAAGYKLVGVVATTADGSVNATPNAAGTEFTYTMVEKDVEMRVVFEKEKDPLEPKGPHIVTVYKVDHDDQAQNDATVTDLDVAIPGYQKGTIWTAAYEGNVVQVDVTTANGYYAVVTAKTAPGGVEVPVAQFTVAPGSNDCYAQFYMPAGTDVDVTVKYVTGNPPQRKLELEVLSGNNDTDNSAKITVPGGGTPILAADGVNTTDGPVSVASGTPLTLTTGHSANWSVKSAVLRVTVSATSTMDIPIPLTDGVSLPIPAMPMADAKVIVEFQNMPLMPRPYDPEHANAYTSSYNHYSADDLSRTHQDGWIQATDVDADANSLVITVPTLHEMDMTAVPTPVDALHHAGYDPDDPNQAPKQPKYNLYWKDALGEFHLFDSADITIDNQQWLEKYYTDDAHDGSEYDGYRFRVTVNKDTTNPNDQTYPTLWGGYTLREYIQNGGSIYIAAEDPADPKTKLESEKTEVVVPAGKRYKATLHFETAEGGATMTAWSTTANTDGQTLTGTNGTEKVIVKPAPLPGYVTVGVVATTDAGSVNATWNAAQNQYEYDMVNKDVDIYVVFDRDDDPLEKKGPHIVTVIKTGDDGYATNSATVTDLDVDIPATQKGTIWTAAYEGNVVQVDVTTEPGYYPVITAVRKSDGVSIDVATFMPGANQYYGKFYMPAGTDVDVTVEFIAGTLPTYTLILTVNNGGNLVTNNATVSMPSGVSLNANGATLNQAGPVNVQPGTPLTLTTGHGPNHSVKRAELKLLGTGITMEIPLIDGESLPIPVMPMSNAEIVVEFQNLRQMPRPYNPLHSQTYNGAPGGDYPSAENPDLSETGQEGWLLATDVDTDERSFIVTVPTLHDKSGAYGADVLHNAVENYELYWKDELGNFNLLTADDVTVSDLTPVNPSYKYGNQDYSGYKFKVTVNKDTANLNDPTYPTLWGGYTVWDYIQNGGSLYISALDPDDNKAKSEKTELVIPGNNQLTATLIYTPNGDSAKMTAWTKVTTDDGGVLTGSNGTEVVTVSDIQPTTGYELVGVVATTADGSVNAIPNADGTEYTYTMENKSVEMRVVFRKSDDPLQEKGPHIVTVYKEGTDGFADNDATVTDLDVVIPSSQRGDIWTAAYKENTVEVAVTTHTGYHAVITAVKAGTSDPVAVIQYPDRGLLEMIDADVDVTVKYVKGAIPKKELKLIVTSDDGSTLADNKADVTPNGASTPILQASGASTTDGPVSVAPGDKLTLATGHHSEYSVREAVLRVTTATGTKTIAIPLTDGASLPEFEMPMSDAEVEVWFQHTAQTPRPYNPEHAHEYTSSYNHYSADDLSRTHQDGWIQADTAGPDSRTITITVPTLHDMTGDPTADTLHHAGYDPAGTEANKQPYYILYWRDEIGNFHQLIEGANRDVTYSNGTWLKDYYEDTAHGGGKYDGYRFDVTLNNATPANPHDSSYPTLWGGYTLWQYIQNGGSLYITATQSTADAPAKESEKTEVVIRSVMPRPFDPDHDEDYNANYDPDTDDLSESGQDGWILADDADSKNNTFKITVPTLHGEWGTVPPGTLYDAVEQYKLYYKDANGDFKELEVGENKDITISGETVETEYYEDNGGNKYDGYSFTVKVVMTTPTGGDPVPATAGGEALAKYIAEGGVIYITAIDPDGKKDESEKTEVVFDVNNKLQPYDPENENDKDDPTPYEDHWITAENRGDYLVVTVPMINKGGATDNTDAISVDKEKHTFQFYLKDEERAADTTNYPDYEPEDLAPIIELTHPDPDNNPNDDPYENDVYYTDKSVNPNEDYNGARFILTVKTDEDIEKWVDDWADDETAAGNPPAAADVTAKKERLKELAAMLRAVMDNAGTTEAIENGVDYTDDAVDKKSKYRLYITHEEAPETADGEVYKSPYVDFEIPRYYAFKGILESYAPKHDATFTLYPLKEGVDLSADPTLAADPDSYEEDAFLTYKLTQDFGTGLWRQDFSVKSSHLMQRDKSGQVYKLVISKPGHVSYIWLGLELTPKTLDDPADEDCLTFTLDPDVNDGMIALIGGDVNQNGSARLDDYSILLDYMDGGLEYSRTKNETDTDWAISTWNPESLAHAADLDGDGRIGTNDLSIINHERNFAKGVKEYVNAVNKPTLLSAAGASGGGTFMAYAAMGYEVEVEKTLPKWAEELLAEGKTLPQWAEEMLTEEKTIPTWVVTMIQNERDIPAWAITMVQDEKGIPAWAIACVEAGTEVPAWAAVRLAAEQEIPAWAVELIQEGKSLPAWAVELLQNEKTIPAWAVELAQAGESLPEEMEALLAAGEELPEELPAEEPELPELPELPGTPEVPETPELPLDPETPGEGEVVEEPEAPETPEETEEPEVPEIPEGSEEPDVPVVPEEGEEPEETEEPDVPVVPEEGAEPETDQDSESAEEPEASENTEEPPTSFGENAEGVEAFDESDISETTTECVETEE